MINASYYERLANVESNNDPLAKNPKSTAKGKYQFTESTAKQYGLDKFEFGSPEYAQAEEAAVRQYTQDNFNYLKSKLNREPTNGELYLAHQQGAGGAENIITADSTAKAVDVLGRDQVLNNGGNENMTLEEFGQKWASKFNDLDAQEKGLVQNAADQGLNNDAKDKIEINPYNDFQAINQSNSQGEINPYNDFQAKTKDEFIPQKDVFGDIKPSMIDQSTGAPSHIRQAVGSLMDPESRLATLQKYYPDAQPYGDNNFVFTNPETKSATLYNPIGLDVGDVPSVTKEAFVTVGSSIGAGLGAATGAVASVPTFGTGAPITIPSGALIGAGAGAGVSAALFDAWMTLSGQTKDIRTPAERAGQVGAEALGAAAGEGLGRAIPVMAKEAMGGAKATQRAIVDQFERFGIRPTASVAMGAKSKAAESALRTSIFSVGVMAKQAEDVIEQSHAALEKIAAKYGKPKTNEGAGALIVGAAKKATERAKGTTSKLYDDAYDLVGSGTLVNINSVKSLLNDMVAELSRAPASRSETYGPAINTLKSIVADDAATGIDFETFRAIRTDIGRNLAEPFTSGYKSSQNLAMKRVYSALSDDMTAVAENAGPAALQAIKRADKYKAAYSKTAEETLEKILKYDAEEKAYTFVLGASKDNAGSLRKLRKLFKQDEWDDVSATVLNRLGTGKDGEFSIATFVNNYTNPKKLSPEAKEILFKGGRYKEAGQALDDFADLMKKLKDSRLYDNASNTGNAINTVLILTSLGSGVAQGAAGAFTGEQAGVGPIAGAAGAIIAPRLAAKLITNPAFVKWLAYPINEGTKDIAGHLGRLVAIGEATPEINDAVQELIKAMEQNTRP